MQDTHTYVRTYICLGVGSSIKDSTYRKFCLSHDSSFAKGDASWSSGTVVSVNLNCSVAIIFIWHTYSLCFYCLINREALSHTHKI